MVWWSAAVLGSAVVIGVLVFLLVDGTGHRLDDADKLASVGSLLIGAVGLGLSVFSVLALLRPGATAGAAGDPAGVPAVVTERRLWNVPPQVRTFIGREPVLERLAEVSGPVVLHGPPGVGKSQLALAWAHSHADTTEIGWWVRAESTVTAIADLAELATALGVGDPDVGQAARNAVAELGRRRGWLLVLDDAVNAEAVRDWLPHRPDQLLITSRSPSWDTIAEPVEVPPLMVEIASEFLADRVQDTDGEAARALAEALGGLPLALEQAAAHCRQTGRSLAGYLALYRAVGGTRLLYEGAPDSYVRGPVTVTVRLAVRLAARRDPVATQLLSLLAYLAPTEIPRDLPALAPEVLPRRLRRAARDPVRLDQAIRVLVATALVAPDRPGHLRVHQLVQDIVRQGTGTAWPWRRAGSRWAQAATRLLAVALGSGSSPADLRRMTVYTPHAQALIQHLDGRSTDSARLQLSINTLATKMRDAGEVDEARQLVAQVLAVRRRVLGPAHPDTLASMTDLAATLSAAGDHPAAITLLEQKVEQCRQAHGPQHQLTITALNDLAAVMRRGGRLASARDVLEKAFQGNRRLLGAHHPQTRAAESVLSQAADDMDRSHAVFRSQASRMDALLDQALSMIDKFEREEVDPDRLERLYRLDHLVSRARRRNTVTALFSQTMRAGWAEPMPLADVLLGAISETEDYRRVEIVAVASDVTVAGALIPDLILLLAELIDNASAFSPPHTQVRLTGRRAYDGRVFVEIEDAGLGIGPDQLVLLNDELRTARPLHEMAADRYGLAVVSWVAARHGISVTLATNRYDGITATIVLPG